MGKGWVAGVGIFALALGTVAVVWGSGMRVGSSAAEAGREATPEVRDRFDLAQGSPPAAVTPVSDQAIGSSQASLWETSAATSLAPTSPAGIPPAESTPIPTTPIPITPVQSMPGYDPISVQPVEPVLPEPLKDLPPIWASLNEAVYQVASNFPGRLSVVAVDLTSGSRYEFRPRDPYLPASTFKLPVALCTLEAIARGDLSWDTPVTYTEADDEPVGAGGFATAPFGGQYPVRNLVDRSLISSNNVAVKMLARTLTWEGLLDCTTRIGGPVTRTTEGSTPVTAADEAAWWLHLWKTHQERPDLAQELLRPLRQVTYYGRIQAGTPQPHLVIHKFGTYAGYDHDGAIVWAEKPYVLVVMTYGGGEFRADQAIERIAAEAWAAVQGAE